MKLYCVIGGNKAWYNEQLVPLLLLDVGLESGRIYVTFEPWNMAGFLAALFRDLTNGNSDVTNVGI